jgi:hypothetical protein
MIELVAIATAHSLAVILRDGGVGTGSVRVGYGTCFDRFA